MISVNDKPSERSQWVSLCKGDNATTEHGVWVGSDPVIVHPNLGQGSDWQDEYSLIAVG